MSTEAEELLGQLVEKLENLENKVQAIAKENGSLRNMIKLIYEQNYKLVKEAKNHIRANELEKETTGSKETSRKDEA